MNGLFVNCAIAASTVATGTLIMETRLAKEGKMFEKMMSRHALTTASENDAYDQHMNRLRAYAAVAQQDFANAATAATRAEQSASDANTSAHEARETSTATVDRVPELIEERGFDKVAEFNERVLAQDDKIQILEATLNRISANRASAGDLDLPAQDVTASALAERGERAAAEAASHAGSGGKSKQPVRKKSKK